MQGGFSPSSFTRNAPALPFSFSRLSDEFLCSRFTFGDMDLKVYCAKFSNTKNWNSTDLAQAVSCARRSYQRYGDVPLFDAYDDRAAVYITVARYPRAVAGLDVVFEEATSVRFVPGCGKEPVLEDFELFEIAGVSLTDYLKTTPYQNRAILDHLVSISRFCATEPVPSHDPRHERLHISLVPPPKRRSTALAFILMNQCFFEREGHRFEYLSGVMRRELMVSLARGSRVENLWPRSFPLANDFLDCAPCDIVLSRAEHVVYDFPGYFLHAGQLHGLIAELLETDRISEATLREILRYSGSFDIRTDFARLVPRLGTLLQFVGDLPSATISGDYLRELLGQRVADCPRLYLGYTVHWQSLLNRSLKAFSRQLAARPPEHASFSPIFTYASSTTD